MIRRAIFRLHLSVALAAGMFIVTMAATGIVLACEDTVMSLAERSRTVAVPRDTPRLPPGEVVEAAERWAERRRESFTATSIEYRSRPGAAVQVHSGRDRRVFVDPWTGEVLGGGFPVLEGFFDGVRGWHRWLGAPAERVRTGRAVTGAANVAFLFLLLTGPLLWMPRPVTRRSLRGNLLFRRGARGTARRLNWHHVVGIWSVVPLIGISATGVVMSYPGLGDRVYAVLGAMWPGGGGGPARVARGDGGQGGGMAGGDRLGRALAAAEAQVPGWRSIVLVLPRRGGAEVRVDVRSGRAGQPQKAVVLEVHGESGTTTSAKSFRDETPGHRAREFLRYAHTGEYWGLAGQALAGFFALGAVTMAWTGFSVALAMYRLRRRSSSGD